MDKVIDDVLLKSLDLYKKARDMSSNYQLAQDLEVTQATVSRWYNGKTKTIKYHLWKSIELKISEFLSVAEREHKQKNQHTETRQDFEFQVNLSVFEDDKKRKLKKLFSNLTDDMADLLSEATDETESLKYEVAENSFASYLQTQGASHVDGVQLLSETHPTRSDFHYMSLKGGSMAPTFQAGQKILVHGFAEPLEFGDNSISIEDIMQIIPEDTFVVYELNGAGLDLKRAKYQHNQNSRYAILHADNEKWAAANNFPRIVRKSDDFKIYGRVIK